MRRSTSTRAARVGALLACAALIAWGCSTQQTPTPGTSGSPGAPAAATSVPVSSPAPAPAYADTLRIGGVDWGLYGIEMDELRQASGGNWWITAPAVGSRYPRPQRPLPVRRPLRRVPDLADGPCATQGEGDGHPLPAHRDDVPRRHAADRRRRGLHVPPVPAPHDLHRASTGSLKEVLVVDHADGRLRPLVGRSDVPDGACCRPSRSFRATPSRPRTPTSSPPRRTCRRPTSRSSPTRSTRRRGATRRSARPASTRWRPCSTRIGVRLYREDFSRETGRFEACTYMSAAGGFIRQAATALETAADPDAGVLDAVAAAFQLLSTDWEPIGTGPYRFVSEDARPGPPRGLARLPRRARGDTLRRLRPGQGRRLRPAGRHRRHPPVRRCLGSAYRATAERHGVRWRTPPQSGLPRPAVQRPARAASSPTRPPPGAPAVHRPAARRRRRDGWRRCPRSTARSFPAAGPTIPTCRSRPATSPPRSGSSRAPAGSSGRTASTRRTGSASPPTILVRADAPIRMHDGRPDRPAGARLRDGPPQPADDLRRDLLDDAEPYPHVIPGTDEPFDLYLGVWRNGVDPDDGLSIFVSSADRDAEHPDNVNFGGFSDPAFDALVAAGEGHLRPGRAGPYLPARPSRSSRRRCPHIFLWANDELRPVRAAVATVDGPLDLAAPNWSWQPERMVVAASSP